MLYQQWLSSADLTIYLVLNLMFLSRTDLPSRESKAHDRELGALQTKLTGRRIAAILLIPMGLIFMGELLQNSGLVSNELAEWIVVTSGFTWILAMLVVGVHLILNAKSC